MKELFKRCLGITEERLENEARENAKDAITLEDIDNVPYICFNKTPLFRIVGDSGDADDFTVPVSKVPEYLKTLREKYVKVNRGGGQV